LNYMLAMSKRYMGSIDFNDAQTRQLQRSIRGMFYLFSVYTLLVFYSAIAMSKEAWAFISGALFYIIIAGYFGFEFLRNRFINKPDQKTEWLPLVDLEGKVTGKAPRAACHTNKDLLHPVVHMHVFNTKGELYLQKRSLNKLIQPGKWDTAVGGHIAFGEDLMQSLNREAFEEIGLTAFNPLFVSKYKWVADIESELVYVFITITDQPLQTQNNEIDDALFWPIHKLKHAIGKELLTPNLEHELNQIIFHPDFNQAIKKAASLRL